MLFIICFFLIFAVIDISVVVAGDLSTKVGDGYYRLQSFELCEAPGKKKKLGIIHASFHDATPTDKERYMHGNITILEDTGEVLLYNRLYMKEKDRYIYKWSYTTKSVCDDDPHHLALYRMAVNMDDRCNILKGFKTFKVMEKEFDHSSTPILYGEFKFKMHFYTKKGTIGCGIVYFIAAPKKILG